MKRIKASELIFISQISRDGKSVEILSEDQAKDLQNGPTSQKDVYSVFSLSMSNKTYVAHGFNSYVVKLKPIKKPFFIKVMGTFTGQDGSCGYKRGKEYSIVLKINPNSSIEIFRNINDFDGYCIYESIIPLLENWAGPTFFKILNESEL